MKMLAIELTFLLAHVRNQNEKKVKILKNEYKKNIYKVNVNKKTQNKCKQRKYKVNVNKKNAK